MGKVSIVYWSGTGNTEAMAAAMAEGAKDAGAEVELLTVDKADAAALSEAQDLNAVAQLRADRLECFLCCSFCHSLSSLSKENSLRHR